MKTLLTVDEIEIQQLTKIFQHNDETLIIEVLGKNGFIAIIGDGEEPERPPAPGDIARELTQKSPENEIVEKPTKPTREKRQKPEQPGTRGELKAKVREAMNKGARDMTEILRAIYPNKPATHKNPHYKAVYHHFSKIRNEAQEQKTIGEAAEKPSPTLPTEPDRDQKDTTEETSYKPSYNINRVIQSFNQAGKSGEQIVTQENLERDRAVQDGDTSFLDRLRSDPFFKEIIVNEIGYEFDVVQDHDKITLEITGRAS